MAAMHPAATALAAGGLLLAGGATGAALTAGSDTPATPERRAAPAPVDVRTEVVHRTVHVVRHIKPKRRAAPATATPAVVAPRPQPVAATVARPAPRPARPLRTRSSATTGGGEREHEVEHEGADD
jgi:hypothetical protein